jgi:hypothetical protein
VSVVRINSNDNEATKEAKRKEIEEAKRSLEATREAIKKEFELKS